MNSLKIFYQEIKYYRGGASLMKEFIKNEKVLGLVRKAIQEKTITYEEINRELKDELPVDKIESLIEGMIDQGIDIIKEEDLKKHLEEHENDDLDDKKY